MKKCCRCGNLFPENNFYKNKTKVNGYQGECKECFNWLTIQSRKNRGSKYLEMVNRYTKRTAPLRRKKEKDLKEKIYQHYGNKCACCGLNDFRFLTIDHKNNDGYKERVSRMTLYSRIIKANFPDTFQLLCWNCNCTKAIYGECPHRL